MTDQRYTFEQARIRLEEIAGLARKKDTSLEKSLDLLEEGVRLANICTDLVDHTDLSATVTVDVPDEVPAAAAPAIEIPDAGPVDDAAPALEAESPDAVVPEAGAE